MFQAINISEKKACRNTKGLKDYNFLSIYTKHCLSFTLSLPPLSATCWKLYFFYFARLLLFQNLIHKLVQF